MKYLKGPVPKPKRRFSPSQFPFISKSSPVSSSSILPSSSYITTVEQDLTSKSNNNFIMSRHLRLKIPKENQYFHQPTLQEILSNAAPSPWTLGAFMAYLSQNHCLETLEFTMDAARYEKHYHAMLAVESSKLNSSTHPVSPEREYIRNLWHKLLDAYIRPNAPREVNLPCEVRDNLLSLPCSTTCPDPSELVSAIKITYELMDQSVLVPFLNATTQLRDSDPHSHPCSSTETRSTSQLSDERSPSPPNCSHNDQLQLLSNPQLIIRESTPLTGNNCFRSGCRISSSIFGSSSAVSSSSSLYKTAFPFADDISSSAALLTPPNTPPNSRVSPSICHYRARSDGNSVLSATSSSWKKMGAKFYRKKTRSPLPNNSID